MARIPLIQPEELPEDQRELLSSGINLHKVMIHSPRATEHFRGLTRFIRDGSSIDPRLRELALIQVGYTSRCVYEYTHHVKVGLKNGVTEAEIHALARDSAGLPTDLDAVTRAVLQGARELTAGYAMSGPVFDELQAALGNEALIDLIVSTITYGATVRILETFEIDLEDEYNKYLEQFPLPA